MSLAGVDAEKSAAADARLYTYAAPADELTSVESSLEPGAPTTATSSSPLIAAAEPNLSATLNESLMNV